VCNVLDAICDANVLRESVWALYTVMSFCFMGCHVVPFWDFVFLSCACLWNA